MNIDAKYLLVLVRPDGLEMPLLLKEESEAPEAAKAFGGEVQELRPVTADEVVTMSLLALGGMKNWWKR